MQIEPQVTLPLVYQLTDPSDSATYYVRAVITDSRTGQNIDTVNLTSQGNGRYTTTVQAPQDPTGMGRHIDIVVSVYTDSGYSTYSDKYAREIHQFLVKRTVGFFGGAGAGVDIDYEKIKKIVEEVCERKIKEHKPKEVSLSKVHAALNKIALMVSRIEMPEIELPQQEKLDLGPILTELRRATDLLSTKIAESKTEPTDITPVLDALQALEGTYGTSTGEVKDAIAGAVRDMTTAITEGFATNSKNSAKIKKLREAFELELGEMEDDPESMPKKVEKNPEIDKYFKK